MSGVKINRTSGISTHNNMAGRHDRPDGREPVQSASSAPGSSSDRQGVRSDFLDARAAKELEMLALLQLLRESNLAICEAVGMCAAGAPESPLARRARAYAGLQPGKKPGGLKLKND